jgi:hypothetical protein
VGKGLKDSCNGKGNNTQAKKAKEPASKDGKKNTTKK